MDKNKNLKKEDNDFRIRNLLRENEVKLWLPPYYQPDSQNDDSTITDQIMELATRFHETLNIDVNSCSELLLEVQKTALHRMREREEFKSQGLATLRIKISGSNIPEFSIQLMLTNLGDVLRRNISEKSNISKNRLKLISSGKVLKFDKTLMEQEVKHGCSVLVLVLPETVEENNEQNVLQETIEDIKFLTKSANHKFFSIADQFGNSLSIPSKTRKTLIMAMTLHEKGRAALKKEQYSLALLFFLEADNEFKKCGEGSILDCVDNYAILNLDIVWCYLHLESVYYLADAENRLKLCDSMFTRSYGKNLERLGNIKGSTGNEAVLLVRLHLLQAITAHLSNKRNVRKLFADVGQEIEKLKIDPDKIDTLVKLGFSPKEARLGLRAGNNDMKLAEEHLIKQRELKVQRRKIEEIRKMTKHTKCINGDAVKPEMVELLLGMGFSSLTAIVGLKNCNNDLNETIAWIQNFNTKIRNEYPHICPEQLSSINMKSKTNIKVLKRYNYELNELCIEELLCLFYLKQSNQDNLLKNSKNQSPDSSQPSTSSDSSQEHGKSDKKGDVSDSLSENEAYAFKRVAVDVTDTNDDYLDLTLESEEKFYDMYKSLIG